MMKNKLILLVVCALLSGCIKAGDFDLVPVRRKIFNAMNGYSIDYADYSEEWVQSKVEREHDYVMNKAVTVKKGEPILSDKYFNRDTYRTWVYKPNKKGALQNHSYPMRLDNKKEYNMLGWITVDGVRYGLLDSGLEDYVFLFDDTGRFYNRAGKIENGIVTLLDEEIFVYPSDLKMQIIAKMRDEVSNVKNGYEVKFNGVKLDRIWFDYLDYDDQNNNGGQFERISFPNKPGLITINGMGFRILKADNKSLTYMLLKDAD